MRGSKIRRFPSFFERRRARQAGDGAGGRTYTLELAVLHMQLLVAMAAVDEQVRHVEVEEVLAFIDRPSLRREDLDRLESLARAAIADPPALDALLGQLAKLASKPAVARLVVDDLARVAAADSREDPRERLLLDTVCDALKLERVEIQIDDPSPVATGASAQPPRRPSGARHVVVQHRARSAVRKALEASYREDARRDAGGSR